MERNILIEWEEIEMKKVTAICIYKHELNEQYEIISFVVVTRNGKSINLKKCINNKKYNLFDDMHDNLMQVLNMNNFYVNQWTNPDLFSGVHTDIQFINISAANPQCFTYILSNKGRN